MWDEVWRKNSASGEGIREYMEVRRKAYVDDAWSTRTGWRERKTESGMERMVNGAGAMDWDLHNEREMLRVGTELGVRESKREESEWRAMR